MIARTKGATVTTVELRDETGAELDRQRQAGNYGSADEVVPAGPRLLDEGRARAEVRAKVAAGLAELDRGEGLDGAEVFRELLAGLDEPAPGGRV